MRSFRVGQCPGIKRRIGLAVIVLPMFFSALTANAQEKRYETPKAIPITPILPMESAIGDVRKTLPQSIHQDARSAHSLTLTATLAKNSTPISSGLIWRIYAVSASGEPALVSELIEASPRQVLPQGNYIVHASYGFASAMEKVALNSDTVVQLQINAGGLRITGVVGKEPISPQDLTYSVFLPEDNNPEGRLVAGGVASGSTLRLPEGDYHVVSHYGTSNAISRTDLTVEVGKVTDATINHRGAKVTLKLVANEGAEAFAGTAFSILTPGGDTIHEEVGAFPSLILSEGEYIVIARHEGQVYTQEFTVESGVDNDIEIIGQQ